MSDDDEDRSADDPPESGSSGPDSPSEAGKPEDGGDVPGLDSGEDAVDASDDPAVADATAVATDDAGPGDAGGLTPRDPDRTSYLRRLVRVPRSRVGRAVVAITVLALLARLVMLGQRTAHWDEGRVAYWTLRYAESGYFEYRPIVHGPFLFQINGFLFSFVGSNDFVARLPVATVGGLLPAAAWLFRERLRGSEVVALAGFLALNPLLVYYSRFMRNDVLVAAFTFFSLGYLVRAYDTRNGWYVVPAGLTLALGFTAKENALVYLVCWFGAAALLFDHRMLDAVRGSESKVSAETIRSRFRDRVASPDLHSVGVAAVVLCNPLAVYFALEKLSLLVWVLPPLVFGGYLVAIRDPEVWEHLAVVGVCLGILQGTGVLSGLSRLGLWVGVLGVVGYGGYRALDRGANPWHFVGTLAFVGFVHDVSAGPDLLETMLGYTLLWLLLGALLVDEQLFSDATERVRSVRGSFPPMLAVYVVTIGTLVFFYAPRHPDPDVMGLWNAMREVLYLNFGVIPDLVEAALLDSAFAMHEHWVSSSTEWPVYFDRLDTMIATMIHSAGLLFAFAGLGFVYDRWKEGGPRDVVAMAGYWGFVSVLGYPYATDIWAPWIAVHAIVPLAVPAAVGFAALYRYGRGSLDRGNVVTGTLVGALLIALVTPAAITAADVSYANSDGAHRMVADLAGQDQSNDQYVLQWAQPDNSLKSSLKTVREVVRTNDGTDVLFFGTTPPGGDANHFYVPDDEVCLDRPPVHEPEDQCLKGGLSWHSRLPLPWYLESYGANVTSTHPDGTVDDVEEFPPVVFAFDYDRNDLRLELPRTYEVHTHPFKLWGEEVVVFVDAEAIPAD
jgi:uncharacterized protein (TIGR03663 family)